MGGKIPKPKEFRFWRLLKQAVKAYGRDNMYVYAGNMAFIGMLAVFPFLIVLISLSALIGQTEAGNQFLDYVFANLPDNVTAQIRGPVEAVLAETTGNILTISIIVALWTTIRGVNAARIAVMKAYGLTFKKTSHALLSVLVDLGLVLGAVFLILVTLFVLVTGPAVLAAIERWLPAEVEIVQYWDLSRYVISPLVLFIALFSLYFLFVPKYGKRVYHHAPGALLALFIWFLMAALFSLYLRYMGELSLLYGSLTGVIILQLFLFFLSLGFLLGAELNGRYTGESPAKAGKV
ncbi:MAG: YihY/virulence factor BrkB family protein [Proteobacteria bacterium]|nr:YihY/virulence factor BrkB family protein [Pseudomonadota bacterium]